MDWHDMPVSLQMQFQIALVQFDLLTLSFTASPFDS